MTIPTHIQFLWKSQTSYPYESHSACVVPGIVNFHHDLNLIINWSTLFLVIWPSGACNIPSLARMANNSSLKHPIHRIRSNIGIEFFVSTRGNFCVLFDRIFFQEDVRSPWIRIFLKQQNLKILMTILKFISEISHTTEYVRLFRAEENVIMESTGQCCGV